MARHFTLRKLIKAFQPKQSRFALLIFFLIMILLTVFSVFWLRKPDQEINNPEGTVGNTAGNLNNYGLFCEYNGIVYFSNSFDDGSLYAMTADEGDITFLSSATVQTLLAGGDYLYYFQSGVAGSGDISNIASKHGFCRSDLKGKHVYTLTDNVVITGQLVNNYLYLLALEKNAINFCKLRCDKSENISLADYSINPACASDGLIYYNGTQDNHYLYTLNTETDVPRQILPISLWYPIKDGDYLYYMDIDHNYRLCRYSFSQQNIQVLTEDRVDCFNVGSGYIYYQKNSTDEPQLKCMRTDGTDVKVLADGNYTRINLTSKYAYFQDYESRTQYHSPLGSGSVSLFSQARDAAMARQSK